MVQLIQLAPLSDFFFGGEATFGQGQNQHYYVRSNPWPQQTTLLGMLRYELLKSAPLAFDLAKDKITNPDEADNLIGRLGFDGSHTKPFGIVDGISPVFLLSPSGIPHFMRSKMCLEGAEKTFLVKKTGFKVSNLLSDAAATPNDNKEHYQLMQTLVKDGDPEAYNGKTEFEAHLIGSDGTIVPMDEVFKTIHQVHNRKEYDGSTDDSGFFKQDMFRLATGWRFAFLAAFNEALPEAFGTQRQVQLGGERRFFALNIGTPPDEHFKNIHFEGHIFKGFEQLYGNDTDTANSELAQVLLLNDAQVAASINEHAAFVHSAVTPFRHLNTNMKDPNDSFQADKTPKSVRRNLLQRGSVFYTKTPENIEQHIQQQHAFQRIGYNYFKTINAQ
jgi:CRISPR-associated protein Cmr3